MQWYKTVLLEGSKLHRKLHFTNYNVTRIALETGIGEAIRTAVGQTSIIRVLCMAKAFKLLIDNIAFNFEIRFVLGIGGSRVKIESKV